MSRRNNEHRIGDIEDLIQSSCQVPRNSGRRSQRTGMTEGHRTGKNSLLHHIEGMRMFPFRDVRRLFVRDSAAHRNVLPSASIQVGISGLVDADCVDLCVELAAEECELVS